VKHFRTEFLTTVFIAFTEQTHLMTDCLVVSTLFVLSVRKLLSKKVRI